MKRVIAALLAIAVAVLGAYGIAKGNEQKTDNGYINFKDYYDNDVSDYYGCPNSKRVYKLNLRKNKKIR